MSGGTFEYRRYFLNEVVEKVKEEIKMEEGCYPEYTEETIKEFKKAIKIIKQAKVYIDRIDYLLAGDDSEEDFHKRLKEELSEIK
jgi:2,4-dienoyl-CoA reductase-like NADH-dependent reductase (Old Yellow Enzyme family)